MKIIQEQIEYLNIKYKKKYNKYELFMEYYNRQWNKFINNDFLNYKYLPYEEYTVSTKSNFLMHNPRDSNCFAE